LEKKERAAEEEITFYANQSISSLEILVTIDQISSWLCDILHTCERLAATSTLLTLQLDRETILTFR